MYSADTKKTLASISAITGNQLEMLQKTHEHVENLTKGSQVTEISPEAQEQIKNLLELTRAQYEALACTQIRKGLATPNMTIRFEDVVNAHHDTFRWLFLSKAPKPSHTLLPNVSHGLVSSSTESNSVCRSNRVAAPEQMPATTTKVCNDFDTVISQHDNSKAWSVWQLDDGYEEENQNWWYRREEMNICGEETNAGGEQEWETMVTSPEYKDILEAGKVLTEWLSWGSGIFHITGKLGSGKSTLMKFLFKHPSTQIKLLPWAGMY